MRDEVLRIYLDVCCLQRPFDDLVNVGQTGGDLE